MLNQKKLCIVTPCHWSAVMGGTEFQLKVLLDKIVPGNQFDLYYLTRAHAQNYRPTGYTIVDIGHHSKLGRFSYLFDSFNLLKALHRIKPHTIYQCVGCAYTGVAALYAKRHGCKMLWHIQSDTDVLPDNRLLNLVDRKILHWGIALSPEVIAQTGYQTGLLRKHFKRNATAIIPNFHPLAKEAIDKTEPTKVVWVANFKPVKQPQVFVNLARWLEQMNGHVKCIMIGAAADWDAHWQTQLENEMKQAKNLNYLGPLPLEEVNSIMAKSHVFVNTSQYEGFPNTFIQAWMRKVPVVSLHVDPDKVLTRHDIGMHAGTFEKLCENVKELVMNQALRARMGENARSYAYAHHSEGNIDELVKRFL